MEFYLQQESPERIINYEIPNRAANWLANPQSTKGVLEHAGTDGEIFDQFLEQYQVIEISSGQPHNDYGQTVWLSKLSTHLLLDLSKLSENTPIPDHLIGEGLPFKPTKMAGVYQYWSSTKTKFSDRPAIEEVFFFPYAEGYRPKRFTDITNSLSPLRYLSTILHQLNFFKVVLVESGVYVRLMAFTDNSAKTPFMMGA